MKTVARLLPILFLVALVAVGAPVAQAAGCSVTPGSGPVGTVFWFVCSGFSANTTLNVYAIEPDGRASGLNIYGFFPTEVKSDADGMAIFYFQTLRPGFYSAPSGDYKFVLQELVKDGGGAIRYKVVIPVKLTGSLAVYSGATLTATDLGKGLFEFAGTGFVPGEMVNTWVTQPPAATCSGLGIDQITLGTLGTDGSSLWFGPGTVKADVDGNISFPVQFRASACIGTYQVTARALNSGHGAVASFTYKGQGESLPAANAKVWVVPNTVFAFNSVLLVFGSGFPPGAGVNCWFTRPDGRVLSFINLDVTTDANGDFGGFNFLDDFPPYTSTDPGLWMVTCATPNRSALGVASFTVVQGPLDP